MKRKPALSIVLSLAVGFTPVSWAQTTAPAGQALLLIAAP